jgi:hypothetical protein
VSTDTGPYTIRLPMPDLVVKGLDHVIRAPAYRDGALVAPTSATVSVYDADQTAVVATAVATISGDIASYTIPAATTSALDVEEGWRVEWELVHTGVTTRARNDAALVLRTLYPVVADVDLRHRVRGLDPSAAASITVETDLQDFTDDAWITIGLRLIDRGNRPNLIMSPSSLRECHLNLALSFVFGSLAGPTNDFLERSEDFYAKYEAAWNRLTFTYDANDDGEADGAGARKAAAQSVWIR